jgi:hypothetical protein
LETAVQQDSPRNQRYNMYAIIHKALRMFMCDTLSKLSNLDAADAQETSACLSQVNSLLEVCAAHLHHENEFVHAAMEARHPGSAQEIATEHEHHLWAIGQLEDLVEAVETAEPELRAEAVSRLYRYLALFIAENFTHMNVEETEHNAVLWATHTDEELIAVEQALVAAIPPAESALIMRWMIPAMTPAERTEKLSGIRLHAPAPVFGMVLGIAQDTLTAREWKRLQQDLGLEEALAA